MHGVELTPLRERFGRDWTVSMLARHDILAAQPGFVAEGVTALKIAVFRLDHHG